MRGTTFIILIMLVSAAVAFFRSPQKAFLNVYLPILLLTPTSHALKISGLPDINLTHAVLLPIIFFFFIRGQFFNWKFSFVDLLLLGFIGCSAYSEYTNDSYWQAQGHAYTGMILIFFPYVLGKAFVEPGNLRVVFAKRVVIFGFIDALTLLYEFFLGKNLQLQIFWRIFPGAVHGGSPTRLGLWRAYGPFVHAILAGLVMVIIHRLSRWLELTKKWKPLSYKTPLMKPPAYLQPIALSKGKLISFFLILGILVTFSRGPWLGAIAGAFVFSMGRSRYRWEALVLGAGLAALLVFVGFYVFEYYTTAFDPVNKQLQASVIYRKDLIQKYWDVVMERPLWGWGIRKLPVVDGMQSIDNFYLHHSLMHGLITVSIVVFIMFWMSSRLLWKGMTVPLKDIDNRLLAFTLLGIYTAIFVTVVTVYMDVQMFEFFCLLTGWSEGYLLSKTRRLISSPQSFS